MADDYPSFIAFPEEFPPASPTLNVLVISSPYRKLPCVDTIKSPLHYFRESDYTQFMEMLPQEVMHLYEKPLDYICGVPRGDHMCKESIYCRLHLFGERALVERSKSLSELILEEMQQMEWFKRFHVLADAFHTCKAYFAGENLRSPRTCSRNSCQGNNELQTNSASNDEMVSAVMEELRRLSEKQRTQQLGCLENRNGEQADLELTVENNYSGIFDLKQHRPGQNTRIGPVPHSKKKFKLIKALFMSKLSRSANAEIEDIVSYLHYKLSCYQGVDLDVRAREMQVQYDSYWSSGRSPQA